MDLEQLNSATADSAKEEFLRCCGSRRWATLMTDLRPFPSRQSLLAQSETIWQGLDRADWLEAFGHHPKIGDINSLREKFANTKQWAEGEQKGVQSASEETLKSLADGNAAYEQKFGYIFIVCATGKSAGEMNDILSQRLTNNPADEIKNAMQEQNKITLIRLEKLLS